MDENTITTSNNPLPRTVSNMTDEEFQERVAQFQIARKAQQLDSQRSATCPVCQARKVRETQLYRFENDIVSMLRTVSVVSLDSCILCVQKHISRAMVYYEELLTAKGSGTADGTASVDVKINHLKVLGNLGCAIDESTDYTELNQLLTQYERSYRYEGIGPDWQRIAEEIVKVEQMLKNDSKPKDNTPTTIKVL